MRIYRSHTQHVYWLQSSSVSAWYMQPRHDVIIDVPSVDKGIRLFTLWYPFVNAGATITIITDSADETVRKGELCNIMYVVSWCSARPRRNAQQQLQEYVLIVNHRVASRMELERTQIGAESEDGRGRPGFACFAISSNHCCLMGSGHTMSVAPQSQETSCEASLAQHLPHVKGSASVTTLISAHFVVSLN
jgi:hypothetical protein